MSCGKGAGLRGREDRERAEPAIPVGHAREAVQQEADDGHLELRGEHGVRDPDMGTTQKQRLSHDKSPRETRDKNGYLMANLNVNELKLKTNSSITLTTFHVLFNSHMWFVVSR